VIPIIQKPSRSLKLLLQLPQQLCTLQKHPGLLQPIRPSKHFCVHDQRAARDTHPIRSHCQTIALKYCDTTASPFLHNPGCCAPATSIVHCRSHTQHLTTSHLGTKRRAPQSGLLPVQYDPRARHILETVAAAHEAEQLPGQPSPHTAALRQPLHEPSMTVDHTVARHHLNTLHTQPTAACIHRHQAAAAPAQDTLPPSAKPHVSAHHRQHACRPLSLSAITSTSQQQPITQVTLTCRTHACPEAHTSTANAAAWAYCA